MRRYDAQAERSPFEERVVSINRVAKVVKGGRRFSFAALVVMGDGAGRVGVGYGKAKEVPAAIQKGVEEAKKNMFDVPMMGSTIPHEVIGEDGAGSRAAEAGGAGHRRHRRAGPVRAVVEAAGINDILSKSLGSSNPINIVHATIAGLKELRRPEDIAPPARPRDARDRAEADARGHGRGGGRRAARAAAREQFDLRRGAGVAWRSSR